VIKPAFNVVSTLRSVYLPVGDRLTRDYSQAVTGFSYIVFTPV